MKKNESLVEKLGFVTTAYLLENLGINSMTLFNLKSHGIIKCHKNAKGNARGYYTYESYRKVKEFMEEYKGYFGHPASLQACLMAFKKKEKNDT